MFDRHPKPGASHGSGGIAVRRVVDSDVRRLWTAAAHLHKPTFLQCAERDGSFNDVEAWLKVEPAGLWVAVLDADSDVFGLAFEESADAVIFRRRWGDLFKIVEPASDRLFTH